MESLQVFAYLLAMAMPFVLFFTTGILALWDGSLIWLGTSQDKPVLVVTTATISNSLFSLLLFGLYLWLSF